MTDFLKDLALVLLGALLALVGDRLSDTVKERRQRRDAFRRLNRLAATVSEAVGHGHDFRNKADWSRELDALANEDRSWLGNLYEPLKRLSWRIRDQSFDHARADASDYCCDELNVDIALLQLAILPHIPMSRSERQRNAKELAHKLLLNRYGVLPADHTELVASFLEDWNNRTVTVERKYAMSCVVQPKSSP